MSQMYRQAAHVRCLICRDGPLDPQGDGFACGRGCGLWDPSIPSVEGTSLAEHGRLVDDQLHPRRCPVCEHVMEIRRYAGLTFDACKGHGIWVAGDDIGYYRQLTSGHTAKQ